MGRQRLAVLVALVTVLGGIPAVGAEHLSVGYEDAPGVSPQEAPAEGDRSVDAEAYARGISEGCFTGNGSSAQEVVRATEADPFCGELVYHNESELVQTSPEDQEILTDEIGTFDVRTTRSYMVAHELRLVRQDQVPVVESSLACQPFCADNPAGQLAWETLHNTGSEAGLTDEAGDADEKERSDRMQIYGADVHTPTARYALEEADTHEMNGWYIPGPTRSFVAFLQDSEGQPIGEERLAQIMEGAGLPEGAVPSVCGWTPDGDFSGTGDAATCEVEFEYEGSREQTTDFEDGYHDKCKSPTYACSATTGGAWYANFDCICTNFPVNEAEPNARDYVKWHWVVAPTLPECGVREPGFLTSTSTERPYLAHDLDVYTNAAGLSNVEDARSAPAVTGSAIDFGTRTANDALSDGLEGVNDAVPDDLPLPEDTPADDVSLDAFLKGHRVEPNAEPVGGLEDTSQSLLEDHESDLARFADDPCEQLQGGETAETIDPWVDIIDGETVKEITASNVGLYSSDDPNQDDDNHPGPEVYHTSGNVGMFTDKNDNGEYDTAAGDTATFSESKLDPKTIEEVGAYPMFWDVRVSKNEAGDAFQLGTNSGCQINGVELTQGAAGAGYGPETGLFQAIYLQEPTVFANEATGETEPYLNGNNIYLLLSDSARDMYDSDIETALDTQIDKTIAELKAYVTTQADVTEPDVQRPGDALGLESDYGPQCPEDTGGFTQQLSFTHSCQLGCDGDTIVTGYTFEVANTAGTIGGGDLLPEFAPQDEPFQFGEGTHTWIDVDPFDDDPDRQDDQDDSPPTGE